MTEVATKTEEWEEPVSLDDAKRLRDDLLADVQHIQAQLSEGMRDDPEWRRKAKSALRFKLIEYRRVKQWISERGRQIARTQGRNEQASRDFIRSLRFVTGGVGRLVNLYDAATSLLAEDSDENWTALEEAVGDFELLNLTEGGRNEE